MVSTVSFNITSYILMMLVIIIAILLIRVVFGVTSKGTREMHAPKIKYSLSIGLVLGLCLPFNETVGLIVALLSVSIFLMLALYSTLVMGEALNVPVIAQTWLPREKVRRLLSYFALIEGVMGIIGLVLPILLSFFFSFQINTPIATLAFASISILADLFDLTFPSPPYRELLSLLYLYNSKRGEKQTDEGNFVIEDPQFPAVLENTDFTVYEIREALELLVRESMAERQTAITPMGRVKFKVSEFGTNAMRLSYEEKMLYLSAKKQSITKILDYFDDEETKRGLSNPRKLRKALEILAKSEKMGRELFKKNRHFLEEDWFDSTLNRINEQRKLLMKT